MNRYCTYFDAGYLAQGLAMWRSLAQHDASAALTVLALDTETERILRALGGERLSVMPLAELLATDLALAGARNGRTRQEFIFTLTPCLLQRLLARTPAGGSLTYLDADLFFFADVAPIARELGEGSVMIVPHRYPPWHDDTERYGRFNVGVVVFRNDDCGRACVAWWRERCLASVELAGDGVRYGDQKYLDEWPQRFSGVVVSANPGINVAPWNWARHEFTLNHGSICVDGVALIVFHFAQFRPLRGGWFDSGQLEYGVMPVRLRRQIYGAYWRALLAAEAEVRSVHAGFALPRRGWRAALGPVHLAVLRMACGQFWFKGRNGWFALQLGLRSWTSRGMGAYRRWQRQRA